MQDKIEKFKEIFENNGFMGRLVNNLVSVLWRLSSHLPPQKKMSSRRSCGFSILSLFRREKCIVYCSVNVPFCSTCHFFMACCWCGGVLPIPTLNSIIYNFDCCRCKSSYKLVVRTLDHLKESLQQNVSGNE